MRDLKLQYPKKIDVAVPANRLCSDCPAEVPDMLRRMGGRSKQG